MSWIVRHIHRIMIVSGLLTFTMVYAAIAPDAALRSNFGSSLAGPVADVVVRNWGALIALIGAMLIYTAHKPALRPLVLAFAGTSKAIFIALVLSHGGRFLSYQAGVAVIVDAVWVTVFAAYLFSTRGSVETRVAAKLERVNQAFSSFVALCMWIGAFRIWRRRKMRLGWAGGATMNRLTSLSFLFRVVAIVELLYAAVGLLTPPSMVFAVTGWVLSPDGQWVTKLLAVALGSQAWVAWTLRNSPQSGVAAALAFYQLGSATVDWVIWLTLADQGVFATTASKVGVLASIPTHYVLGILLVVAIRSASRRVAIPTPALARG